MKAIRIVGVIGCLGLLWANGVWATEDPVAFSFAFVGCNRLNKVGVEATGSDSTANPVQLLQTLKDIGQLSPKPSHLFLLGDIVKGKKDGTKKLGKELDAWMKLTKDQLDPAIKLLVLTGNHELLKKVAADTAEDAEDEIEVPNQAAYPYWQSQMKPYIFGKDGPRKGGPDKLLNNEKRLSYTLTVGDNLFIILNTDSQIDNNTIGDVPLAWLAGALKAGQANPAIKNIFVMGHKPIVAPGKTIDHGAENIRGSQSWDFYRLLNQPAKGATSSKVRAYLSAHAHQWQYLPNMASLGFAGNIPQIIAGNGGSPPDNEWATGYFGYTLVSILQSGKITAQSYGRPIPQPNYYAQTPPPVPAIAQGEAKVLYAPKP